MHVNELYRTESLQTIKIGHGKGEDLELELHAIALGVPFNRVEKSRCLCEARDLSRRCNLPLQGTELWSLSQKPEYLQSGGQNVCLALK